MCFTLTSTFGLVLSLGVGYRLDVKMWKCLFKSKQPSLECHHNKLQPKKVLQDWAKLWFFHLSDANIPTNRPTQGWYSQNILQKLVTTSYEFLKNILETTFVLILKFLQISYKFLTNFSRTSLEFLLSFLQTSLEHFKELF